MSIKTLKSTFRRSGLLVAAFALVAATVLPAASTYADALNPLTDRSLTLSSSSPGWSFTDGSGNSTYAAPNSGANGQKTGNTFSFKVSTDTTANTAAHVKSITFQYCTESAGLCIAPGNNGWEDTTPGAQVRHDNGDFADKSDLDIVAPSASQIEQATLGTYIDTATGAVTAVPDPGLTGSNFVVMYNNAGTWQSADGWAMASSEEQYGDEADGESTGTNNQITLTSTNGTGFTVGQEVKIVFFATDTNYITNPGAGSFFVKINTYNNATTRDDSTLVDGGVTVANVMNQSIQITTKVLETMDFSVGTVDPYTLAATGAAGSQLATAYPGHNTHGPCDPILTRMAPTDPVNTLQMGNALGEFSLRTDTTYSTHSYWRLSSNSSAGATVYYSGVTLSNTVGDQIDPINGGTGTAAGPILGSEQFGLALANGSRAANPQPLNINPGSIHAVNYDRERATDQVYENGADNAANAGIHPSVTDPVISNLNANASYHSPRLYPLIPNVEYDRGAGVVNSEYGAIDTAFAFNTESNLIPEPIATQDTQVVDCVTGKMRYIANIAATTPAGIYTTKINYIAAPQY